MDEWTFDKAYAIPNHFIHSSLDEILLSFEEENGNLSPVSSTNKREREYASMAYVLSVNIIFQILEIQIKHYKLDNLTELLEEVFNLHEKAIIFDESKTNDSR